MYRKIDRTKQNKDHALLIETLKKLDKPGMFSKIEQAANVEYGCLRGVVNDRIVLGRLRIMLVNEAITKLNLLNDEA